MTDLGSWCLGSPKGRCYEVGSIEGGGVVGGWLEPGTWEHRGVPFAAGRGGPLWGDLPKVAWGDDAAVGRWHELLGFLNIAMEEIDQRDGSN
ncbi:hypothetical protein TIFTF001_018916 [Ficus carica]|uniref:Uncharacterized protein n=1 Tax=Ficus carica TaxID=3494 RepID=A0AA88AAP5_FICCA|nr:hypothetical protein TIFTF001_018916 [Ficus carica]